MRTRPSWTPEGSHERATGAPGTGAGCARIQLHHVVPRTTRAPCAAPVCPMVDRAVDDKKSNADIRIWLWNPCNRRARLLASQKRASGKRFGLLLLVHAPEYGSGIPNRRARLLASPKRVRGNGPGCFCLLLRYARVALSLALCDRGNDLRCPFALASEMAQVVRDRSLVRALVPRKFLALPRFSLPCILPL